MNWILQMLKEHLGKTSGHHVSKSALERTLTLDREASSCAFFSTSFRKITQVFVRNLSGIPQLQTIEITAVVAEESLQADVYYSSRSQELRVVLQNKQNM
jgi:hypothetical protein